MGTPGTVVVIDKRKCDAVVSVCFWQVYGNLKSVHRPFFCDGGVPEWLKGTGCKPVGYAYDGSNPSAPTIDDIQGIRGIPVGHAHIAESAEHFLGKEEVTGSSPVVGSIDHHVPRLADVYGGVAQRLEHTVHTRGVTGSNPVTATMNQPARTVALVTEWHVGRGFNMADEAGYVAGSATVS